MTTGPEQGPVAEAPVASGKPPRPPARKSSRFLTFSMIAVVLTVVVAASVFLVTRSHSSSQGPPPRLYGIPANVSTKLAELMALEPLPHSPAPGFTLTDQAGRTMALSSLRGKIVVLEFMDPHCTDICPIVSQEFVDAYHDLGPLASKVVFAAVNVNQHYRSTKAVAAFSSEHQLTSIPDWHFFTGSVPALQAAWRAYHISVRAPNPKADIIHTSAVYFIDPQGRESYLASPQVDHTAKGAAFLPANEISSWGRGIAEVARDMAG